MSNFADDLVAFGPKIKEYADSVFGLDSDAVSNSTNAALILTDLATVVSEIDSGGWSLVGNNSPLVKFGDSIKTFGTKLSEFYQNTSNINTNILSAVIGQVNRLITTAKNMVGMDTVVVADFGKALKDLGESGISGFIEAFELAADRVKQTAEDMLTTFLDGLDSKKLDTTLYFSNLISDILDELGNQYESFKDAGRDLVQGFADGISENIYIAENKASEMAQAAYRSARTALKIHSPSRLFMKLGSYIPKGMAKGISNESGIVSKTVDGMVSESVKMTTQTIAKILDLINSGVESEPVIRPVLDLSNVRTGVGEVNALFSKTQAARIGYDFAGYPRLFSDNAFESKQQNTTNTSTFGDINIYVNGSDLSAEEIAERIGAKVHQIARARGRI